MRQSSNCRNALFPYPVLRFHSLKIMRRFAIIAGAGPAGLTAAYELLKRTDIVPIVCEQTDAIGGIA